MNSKRRCHCVQIRDKMMRAVKRKSKIKSKRKRMRMRMSSEKVSTYVSIVYKGSLNFIEDEQQKKALLHSKKRQDDQSSEEEEQGEEKEKEQEDEDEDELRKGECLYFACVQRFTQLYRR